MADFRTGILARKGFFVVVDWEERVGAIAVVLLGKATMKQAFLCGWEVIRTHSEEQIFDDPDQTD